MLHNQGYNHTHSEYVIIIIFHGNNGYANAPQYYVIQALHVLFSLYTKTERRGGGEVFFALEVHQLPFGASCVAVES
jgi:hypothetical protein